MAAATLIVHALLIGAAWHTAPKREVPRSARVELRLIPPAVRSPDAIRERPAARVEARVSSGKRDRPRPVAPVPAAEAPLARPAEPVTGIAIAIPAIPLPGTAPARWMKPPASDVATPAPPPLGAWAQAQAAREAGRSQLDFALRQQFAAASAPPAGAEGACTLPAQPEARLACDTDWLLQALAPRETALAGLLLALRSMEPRASGLAIAVVQGRYQASWTMDPQ